MPETALISQFVRDSPDAIAGFDPAGNCLFCNEAMRRSGHDGALRDFMAGPAGAQIRKLGLQRTKPVPFGFGQGAAFQRATIRRMLAEQHNPVVVVQLMRNERMAALTAVHRQQMRASDDRFRRLQALARYEAFFSQAFDGIGVLNGQGDLVSANPALCALLRCGETEVFGKPFDSLFRPSGFAGPVFERSGHQTVLAAAARLPFEAVLAQPGGAKALEISLTERRMLRRKEFFVVVRDLTDAHRLAVLDDLNDQLRAAQRVRDEFIYLISHEMRAPLAALVSAAENLRHQTAATPQILQHAQIVEDAATDALTQFSAILEMTRNDAPLAHVLQPAQLVARLLRQHAPVAERLQVDLQGAIAGVSPVDVPIDPARAFLILTNLLSNALKHTPAGASVRFSVRTDVARQTFAIEVSDTGSGIPKHRQGAIFEAFETSADRMDIVTGLGVGLALVRTAVREMGGEISFVSAEGEGTTFQVSLPFASPPQPASAAAPALAGAVADDGPVLLTRGDLVLIADDDAATRIVVGARLRELGLSVAEAETGQQALHFFDETTGKQPRLVLMDRHMPDLGGVDTARLIRTNPMIKQPVIVGLSAYVDTVTLADLRHAGMDRVIQKPLTDQRLAQLVVVKDPVLPGDMVLSEAQRETARPVLLAGLPPLLGLIAAGDFAAAVTAALHLSQQLARLGAQAESAVLRSVTLRLHDGLPPDAEQQRKLAELCAMTGRTDRCIA